MQWICPCKGSVHASHDIRQFFISTVNGSRARSVRPLDGGELLVLVNLFPESFLERIDVLDVFKQIIHCTHVFKTRSWFGIWGRPALLTGHESYLIKPLFGQNLEILLVFRARVKGFFERVCCLVYLIVHFSTDKWKLLCPPKNSLLHPIC